MTQCSNCQYLPVLNFKLLFIVFSFGPFGFLTTRPKDIIKNVQVTAKFIAWVLSESLPSVLLVWVKLTKSVYDKTGIWQKVLILLLILILLC